ncbi:heterokaryon incompatibility protein-domain-containing protein [Rhexocercosporidium sp. MPI-PUGE-AT-0058]|nr:heterokaryon incompatibility protein-domain-containing protein [Rhexocercosporidium sp. MPI-PUGE-AT-0058]
MPTSRCICYPLHITCLPESCKQASLPAVEEPHSAISSNTAEVSFTRKELVQAVKSGCPTCTIIRRSIGKYFDSAANVENVGRDITVTRLEDRLRMVIGLNKVPFEIFNSGVENKESAITNSCKAFPLGDYGPFGTSTESAYETCRRWIEDCAAHHPACKLNLSKLPRRVVAVGHTDGKNFSPYLYESSGEVDSYAALSHCWGATQIITTTTSTLSQRKTRIPFESLSKTFQDAVHITHNLGLKYIWIDSLCIIQDDLKDWETESKKMAAVYESSHVTICAAKSEAGNGGCFADLTLRETDPYSGSKIEVQVRKCPRHIASEAMFRDSSFFHTTSNLPLFTRAWTFQEELLATRVLYYCADEIVFQCKENLDCQCGRISSHMAEIGDKTSKQQYEAALIDSSNIRKLQIQWYRIITQYSARNLTKESDRLPALSGLAGVFQSKNVLGRFLAGLWTHELPLWLTWVVWGSHPPSRQYVAPSWSWASILSGNQICLPLLEANGGLGNDQFENQLCILEVHCELASSDPTGAIRSAFLLVRGRAARAKLVYNYDPVTPGGGGGGGSLLVLPPFGVSLRGKKVNFTCDSSYRVINLTTEGQDVWCLRLLTLRKREFFLVLVPTANKDEYVRIGIKHDAEVDDESNTQLDGTSLSTYWFDDAEEKEMKLV